MKYLYYIAIIILHIQNLNAKENLENRFISQHIDSIYNFCKDNFKEKIFINKNRFPKAYRFNKIYDSLIINCCERYILRRKVLSINLKGMHIGNDGSVSFSYGIWRYSGKPKKIFVEMGYLNFTFTYKFSLKENKWILVYVDIL